MDTELSLSNDLDLYRIRAAFTEAPVEKPSCIIGCGDARETLRAFPSDSVTTIITSPPYADLKNYGTEKQIGFGQAFNQYLPDMRTVMCELHRITKEGGALWMVLDMVKVNGVSAALPWQIIDMAKDIGWDLQDIIVWDKGKSLPWSNRGKFRGVCEFILLLSKGKLSYFNLDAVRDSEHLSSYWVKYPERYHPDGKAPSDLWHFPIPNQGGFSPPQARHFCPFPVGLVARMVAITSRSGDVILDPFSGTGSVATVASHMGRRGVGLEINPTFVEEFDNKGYAILKARCEEEIPTGNLPNNLRDTLIKLRVLKFPKALFARVSRADSLGHDAKEMIGGFLLTKVSETATDDCDHLDSNNFSSLTVNILLRAGADLSRLEEAIKKQMYVPPLSIFGVRVEFNLLTYTDWNDTEFFDLYAGQEWFVYRKGVFNEYELSIPQGTLGLAIVADVQNRKPKVPSIFSTIKLEIENPVRI